MAIGDYRHSVRFQNPGPPTPDGDGGFTQSWTDIPPAPFWVSVQPLTAHDLERVTAGTVLSTATHTIRGRFLAGISIQSRMVFDARLFAITGIRNYDERSIAMELLAVEILGPR